MTPQAPPAEPATATLGGDRLIRRTSITAVIVVALIAAYISYGHAYELVHTHGETGAAARVVPLTVDGLIYASSMVLLQAARCQQRAPWLAHPALWAGIAATGGANAAHGMGHGWVGALVSVWPAVALIVSYELLMKMIRSGGATSTVRHVICAGSSGALTLRRPLPRRDLVLAAAAGARVYLPDVLSGAHPPVVYFIRNGSRVKIGTTGNLRRRISQLSLRPEDVVLVLHGDGEYETELHERFTDLRVGDTEWFKLSGELTEFVSAGGDQGDGRDDDAEIADDTEGPDDEGDGDAATARRRSGGRPRKRVVRHSLDTWADLTESIWRQESDRLERQPTGEEFAAAIRRSRRGPVSVTTAKKIRAEILRRAELAATDEPSEAETPPAEAPEPPAEHTPNGRVHAATTATPGQPNEEPS